MLDKCLIFQEIKSKNQSKDTYLEGKFKEYKEFTI